jgi:hypothetical protein
VHSCDEQKVEHACIIYGRRAMESRHTSVTLHNAIRPILHSVNRFYSRERVGRLYIVHFVNLVYSIFLSALLKPLLSLLDDSSKLVSVQTKLELRDYFDSNGLCCCWQVPVWKNGPRKGKRCWFRIQRWIGAWTVVRPVQQQQKEGGGKARAQAQKRREAAQWGQHRVPTTRKQR